VQPCRERRVALADSRTQISIDQVIRLPVTFVGEEGVGYTATVTFFVFDTNGSNDMIIGLPAIITSFSVLFKQMIDEAVATNAATTHHSIQAIAEEQLHVYPWSVPLDTNAPEDIDTDLPCSFPDALAFMEQGPDAALTEYKSLIDKHVSPEFLAATPIRALLETKGALVFVPQNWHGINGIPPLRLSWKKTLPESIKPRARHVNPKLFINAEIEFERLLNYFYRPSTSPIASCLVIAPKAAFAVTTWRSIAT